MIKNLLIIGLNALIILINRVFMSQNVTFVCTKKVSLDASNNKKRDCFQEYIYLKDE